jgi:putative resolvase
MHLRISQVAKLAGVSASSLRRWDKKGELKPDYKTPGGHRRYNYKKILKFLGLIKEVNKETKVVIYGRVSSSRQKEDLERQIQGLKNYAQEKKWKISKVYKDIGSGLNDQRKGLLKLIADLPKKQPNYIICSYRDRIARFGTNLLEEFCKIYDTKLKEIRIKEANEQEELVSSIIAIMTSFSGKLYRQRRGKVQSKKATLTSKIST